MPPACRGRSLGLLDEVRGVLRLQTDQRGLFRAVSIAVDEGRHRVPVCGSELGPIAVELRAAAATTLALKQAGRSHLSTTCTDSVAQP
jgi:hypothetical protein